MTSPTTDQTLLYEELVRSMFDSGSSKPISNGKPEHAIVLFKIFFERARSRVVIFCQNLNDAVFGSPGILAAAQAAVLRGVSIQVIAQEKEVKESAFKRWLESESKNNNLVSFLKCPNSATCSHIGANFAVMDSKAFRFEPDRKAILAVAYANEPKQASELTRVFELLKNSLLPQKIST